MRKLGDDSVVKVCAFAAATNRTRREALEVPSHAVLLLYAHGLTVQELEQAEHVDRRDAVRASFAAPDARDDNVRCALPTRRVRIERALANRIAIDEDSPSVDGPAEANEPTPHGALFPVPANAHFVRGVPEVQRDPRRRREGRRKLTRMSKLIRMNGLARWLIEISVFAELDLIQDVPVMKDAGPERYRGR